jgi:uncharacterized membrane protein
MMAHSDLFFYVSALVLGIVSGMRSLMALAVLALTLSRRPELAPAGALARWLSFRAVAIVLGVATLAELVVDKLPRTPNRTALGPFVGRLLFGGLAGAALVEVGRLNPWIGAACGVVGAICGTFGMFHARRFAGRATGLRDPYIGAVEDVIAIAIASTVVAMLAG